MSWKRGLLPVLLVLVLVSSISNGIFYYLTDSSQPDIFLSTTTSVQNTGLLDYLIEEYEKISQFQVKYTAVGSGAALQLARDGEVDAVLVHTPELEQDLINEGYADKRNTLWYNYFVIIGPEDDPADISANNNITQVFTQLYNEGQEGRIHFYSRGDRSGTHLKELEIWNTTQYSPDPRSDWYFETGSGMSATLRIVDNDPQAYTIADLGTFTVLKHAENEITPVILYNQSETLYNPYSYLIINANTTLQTKGARDFLAFLQLPSTQELVQSYTIGDTVLFQPVEN